MLKIHRAICLALAFFPTVLTSVAGAQSVTLAWDPSADASGYVVRWGSTLGVYPNSKDTGIATMATVDKLVAGQHYWAVVQAYDNAGQYSDPSEALEFVVPVSCTYTVTSSVTLVADATTGGITVNTSAGCPWTTVSQSPYIRFAIGSGSGPGTATMTLDPNYSTAPRLGTVLVAGQAVTVTQTAADTDALTQTRERARADFNADGFSDLLFQDTSSGYLAAWMLQGHTRTWTAVSFPQRILDNNWRVVGTGDFNGDGKADIVWHHRVSGTLFIWYMNGKDRIGMGYFSFLGEADTRWKIAGIGDFNGDGKPDLVWQHDTGWLTLFLMDGPRLLASRDLVPGKVLDRDWRIAAVADLNGDGRSDLAFQHNRSGDIAGWIMDGERRTQVVNFFPGAILDRQWRLAAVTDINRDQTPDFVWQHGGHGGIAVWYMNGTTRTGVQTFPRSVGPNWLIVGPR